MLTLPRRIAGLCVWKFLSFGKSGEKFKIFLPSFLRYFDLNHAFYYVNKISVLKMNFLLNIDTYLYPSLQSHSQLQYFSEKSGPYHLS